MSVYSFPKMSDFWRKKTTTIFHIAFSTTVMSRNRFTVITSSDAEEDTADEGKRGTEKYDPLQKLKPLLEMIRTHCKSVYHPKQHISVHERMAAIKARIKIKHYMKDKPTKWGLKFFVLADVNGYKLYTGMTNAASGKGLSFNVVTVLVKKDYLGSGFIVYCDNFYTSPLLFRHLSQQGFGACGTYRQGRVGVPTTHEKCLKKKSKRGSFQWMHDNELLFVKWMECPCAPLSLLFTLGRLSCGGKRTVRGKVRGSQCSGLQQWLNTTNTLGVWILVNRCWEQTWCTGKPEEF